MQSIGQKDRNTLAFLPSASAVQGRALDGASRLARDQGDAHPRLPPPSTLTLLMQTQKREIFLPLSGHCCRIVIAPFSPNLCCPLLMQNQGREESPCDEPKPRGFFCKSSPSCSLKHRYSHSLWFPLLCFQHKL